MQYNYGIRYINCINNPSILETLSPSMKLNVLKALVCMSKYLGCYEEFKATIKSYGLRWSSGNSDRLIINRLLKSTNQKGILEWIRDVKKSFPKFDVFMDFITLSGLRFEESISAYTLIQEKLDDYYDFERNMLQHYKISSYLHQEDKEGLSLISQRRSDKKDS